MRACFDFYRHLDVRVITLVCINDHNLNSQLAQNVTVSLHYMSMGQVNFEGEQSGTTREQV